MLNLRIIWVCGLSLLALGQQVLVAQLGEPLFRQLTVEDGLSNNWVKCLMKDSDGFMWFGTFNGLNRYDGREVKVFQASEANGLADNIIESIIEDGAGTIWVGTFSGGLHSFNKMTETFTRYENKLGTKGSIPGNRIYAQQLDGEGNLLVGSNNGLDRFNSKTNTFQRIPIAKNTSGNQSVTAIFRDAAKRIWIGTEQGIYLSEPNKGSAAPRPISLYADRSNEGIKVSSIFEDKYGVIWVGSRGQGLFKIDPNSFNITSIKASTSANALSSDAILGITGDGDKRIFIATEGGGLNIMDLETQTFLNLKSDITNPRTVNSNSIHSLYYDLENNMLWSGTYNGGLNYISKWDKAFKLIQASVNGLNNNHITCVTEDKLGRIWIGTDGGGINIYDPTSNNFTYLSSSASGLKRLLSDAILSILCDRQGNLWIGSFNGGIDVVNPQGSIIAQYSPKSNDATSLSDGSVSSIYQDKRGQIWVGTMSGGLNLFDPGSQEFTRFVHNPANPKSIIDNFIYEVYEDRFGRLLVLTGRGLDIYDNQTRLFTRFDPKLTGAIGVPITILEDSQGSLWVGSQENGLFLIDRTGIAVKSYTVADGLPSNNISGILEDDFGNLWISTHRGLCKMIEGVGKPESKRFHVYSVEDGLQGSEFKRGAFCLRRNGEMVFAGQNGLNIFDPDQINSNPTIPPVKITGFKLFNKEVSFRDGKVLSIPISQSKELKLNYDQSVLTFEFASLNYLLPEKNHYAYMMEGFDDKWNEVGTQTNATYSNLAPGTYTFRVKASNNDGVWNEDGIRLVLTIVPPWWENNYVRGLFILFLIALVYGILQYRTQQLKESKKRLESIVSLKTADLEAAVKVSEDRREEIFRQNESLVETNKVLEQQSIEIQRMSHEISDLNEAKIKFFTNISHELRTPLNLVLWPLEELISETEVSPVYMEKYELMHRNASKLIKLINQLLDVRIVELGDMHLEVKEQNVIALFEDMYTSFQDWARRKSIDFRFEISRTSWSLAVDADKLEKIVSNLLSNAFKYVDKGGKIIFSIREEVNDEASSLVITVKDNGKGMTEAEQKLIFDRFYEGKEQTLPGSGIGLSLVKDLVQIHKGSIVVDSILDLGSTFEVRIPTNLEVEATNKPTVLEGTVHSSSYESTHHILIGEQDDLVDENLSILLVEDNVEIRQILARKLGELYHVFEANHGKEGYEIALDQVPDLIISDIMMPEMDGIEMSRLLKADNRTSHIPIIMLTAKSGDENQLKGLETGVEDYVTKPFQFGLLQLKVKNLLTARKKWTEHIMQNSIQILSEVENQLLDEKVRLLLPDNMGNEYDEIEVKFLSKAVLIVSENIQNEDFGVEDFSQYFGMSRRNVLRKIKALTGLSINEFIRNIRLKKAYSLLSNADLNVSEVAYAVGFSDPKYFSLCFRNQYGKSPSDFKNSVQL